MNRAITINKTALVTVVTLSAVLFFYFFAVGSVSADFWASNKSTGFDSDNDAVSTGSDIFTEVNANTVGLFNDADIDSETGLNESNSNTGSGAVDTGLIGVLGGFGNEFNLNVSDYTNSWWGESLTSENDTTGAESDNDAVSTFDSDLTVTNTNDADLANDIDVDASSGLNESNSNTGSGAVDTGNVASSTVEDNTANGNSVSSSGSVMNSLFSALARNKKTGFMSGNAAVTDVDNDIDISNTNTNEFINDSTTLLETGLNESNSNTGSGEVDTGNASGDAAIINDANATTVDIEVGGDGDNSMESENDTTGADSDNDAVTDVDNDADVTNTNDAFLDNEVDVDASSGLNESNSNTGSGAVDTGNASSSATIENGSIFNHSSTSLLFGDGIFSLMAKNKTTGFSSDNDAVSTLDNDVSVVNDNDAEVVNDADVDSETGLNESNSNTGSGAVDTGNASGAVEITNDLNVNDTTIGWPKMGDLSTSNDTTGAESDNDAVATATNDLVLVNTNDSTLTNTAVVDVSSGSNESNSNTGNGDVETGSATTLFGVTNTGNGNFNLVK